MSAEAPKPGRPDVTPSQHLLPAPSSPEQSAGNFKPLTYGEVVAKQIKHAESRLRKVQRVPRRKLEEPYRADIDGNETPLGKVREVEEGIYKIIKQLDKDYAGTLSSGKNDLLVDEAGKRELNTLFDRELR